MNDFGDRFDMGRVVRRAFTPVRAHFGLCLGLAFLLGGVPTFLVGLGKGWLLLKGYEALSGPTPLGLRSMQVVAGIAEYSVLAVFSLTLQAAAVRVLSDHSEGSKPRLGPSLLSGLRAFLPLAALAFLKTLGFMIGLVLLIVPGLMLLVMWSVAVPVFMEERPGVFLSLARSFELTKGARWKIFALLLAFGLFSIALWLAAAFLIKLLLLSNTVYGTYQFYAALYGPSILVSTLAGLVNAPIVAAIYLELRAVKEGDTPQRLSSIFA